MDYRYQNPDGSDQCRYVHYTESGQVCGCLVGAVLHLHGVPLASLAELEGFSAEKAILHLVDDGHLTITPKATEFLNTLQSLQDSQKTWGQSIERARQWVDRRGGGLLSEELS